MLSRSVSRPLRKQPDEKLLSHLKCNPPPSVNGRKPITMCGGVRGGRWNPPRYSSRFHIPTPSRSSDSHKDPETGVAQMIRLAMQIVIFVSICCAALAAAAQDRPSFCEPVP